MALIDQLEPERSHRRSERSSRLEHKASEELSYRVGQLAYEAYCAACSGRDFNTGAELPPWSHLELEVREAWHAAGDAVWHDCVALHRSRGGMM